MAKTGERYLEIDPYLLVEQGFHKEKNMVSESLFSLGNEYSGVRGYFEEGVSLPTLVGTYYNGIYEYALEDTPSAYKGIVKRTHFTINSTNYLKCRIVIDGQTLDLAHAKIKDFVRVLDMRTGLLRRSFIWRVGEKEVELTFLRLLSMTRPHLAYQSIAISSSTPAHLSLALALDGTILHWGKHNYWEAGRAGKDVLYLKTPTTGQSLLTAQRILSKALPCETKIEEKEVTSFFETDLVPGQKQQWERFICNIASKKAEPYEASLAKANAELEEAVKLGFAGLEEENRLFFAHNYAKSDIVIDGDASDQQGIRFCIFQMLSAYHGLESDNNIGAKGLTGEAYSGHAFWDSETYCLPYYLFNDQQSAKNLLLFRYATLPEAKERAKDLDCEGACFPIATRNGKEACTLWQHASTQLQPTSAVAYAIFHYMNLYHDDAFMKECGAEMLGEIAKFLFSRGQWNASHTHFGYYGVMGPDEFQLMVNHNAYTNFMGKKSMEYALSILRDKRYTDAQLLRKIGLNETKMQEMERACAAMKILFDPQTKLFEQHQGFFDLPHIDVDQIPMEEFPLYSHWTYDRIYRNDMIKQPDVLMFLFLYNQDFDLDTLRANYEFYEPRCIHESSLSPSIHSILAAQIGKEKEAADFFGFATRLDLDDYNRNTCEGLHMTSIAAAWMNIVYGFLGLRSDREILKIAPTLPNRWTHYGVKLTYHGHPIRFDVYSDHVDIEAEGEPLVLYYRDQLVRIEGKGTLVK